MLKHNKGSMFLIAGLMMASVCGVSAAPAQATTDFWSDELQSVEQSADQAKRILEASARDCNGLLTLDRFLTGGASSSADAPLSDELDAVRKKWVDVTEIEAKVQLATFSPIQIPESAEALTRVIEIKNEMRADLNAKLAYCGNGVERRSKHKARQ